MLRAGDVFDRYVIDDVLGEGGMGTVYRARDEKLDRRVALKVVRDDETDASKLREKHERLLREARAAGIRLAIATTTTGENIAALLISTLGPESMDWFEVMASADEVPDKKPSPAVYLYAMEMLGLEAADCVAFEDSENGLIAARRAGLRTIVTVNDYTREGEFGDATLVVDHLGESDLPFTVLGGRAAARLLREHGSRPLGCVNSALLEWLPADD